MRIPFFMIPSFLLASCMHPLMHPVGEGPDLSGEPTLEKEIVVGKVRMTAIFPSLEVGNESLFSLRLTDRMTFKPLSRAKGFAEVERVEKTGKYKTNAKAREHHHTDSSRAQEIYVLKDTSFFRFIETTEGGVCSFTFAPSEPGEYRVAFRVTSIGLEPLDPPIVIEAIRTAEERGDDHHTSMGNMMTLGLVGAATMGVMMLVMIFGRGWR